MKDIIISKNDNLFYKGGKSSIAGLTASKAYFLGNEGDSVIDIVQQAITDGRIDLDVLGFGEWIQSGSDIYYLAGKVSVGTATPDADGVFTVKGTTNDGTTKCVSFTDSDDAEVASIDTDGLTKMVAATITNATADMELTNSSGSLLVQRAGIWKFQITNSVILNLDDLRVTNTAFSGTSIYAEGSGNFNTAFGTTATSSTARVLIKGSTADGSTNCLLLTDSADATVASINTDGGLLASTVVEANTDVAASPNTITADESGKVFTNEGATAENHHDLPTAVAGLGPYTFFVQDVDGIQVNAATGDTIRIAASVSAAGGLIESTSIGNSVTLVAINDTEWVAIGLVGGWTVT